MTAAPRQATKELACDAPCAYRRGIFAEVDGEYGGIWRRDGAQRLYVRGVVSRRVFKPVTVDSDQAQRTSTSWTMREGFDVEVAMHTHRDNRMIVLRHGTVGEGDTPFVRLHSACLTSEALGSTRCDCRDQLDEAIRRIGDEGMGILIYFPDHEGRGIGIEEKLAAYALQDQGHDTTQANVALGHPVDDRDFSAAADLLTEMGITKIRLMTNNPEKVRALESGGIAVERISAWVDSPSHASNYLHHKVQSMSHLA